MIFGRKLEKVVQLSVRCLISFPLKLLFFLKLNTFEWTKLYTIFFLISKFHEENILLQEKIVRLLIEISRHFLSIWIPRWEISKLFDRISWKSSEVAISFFLAVLIFQEFRLRNVKWQSLKYSTCTKLNY